MLTVRCICLFLLLSGAARAQDCDRYLNATDGDDDSSGSTPAEAVRSFEHAFLTFPNESIVCATAGEYFHSSDADGIQLTGEAALDKSMTIVLQSFAGSNAVSFTEDEFRMNLGSGRIRFVEGSASVLRLGAGVVNSEENFPENSNRLLTVDLISGTLDVSSVHLVFDPAFEGTTSGFSVGAAAPVELDLQRLQGDSDSEAPLQNESEFVHILPDGVLQADSLSVTATTGAPSSSVVITSSGRIGIGTLTSPVVDLTIRNEGGGSVELGVAERRSRIDASIENATQGTARLMAASDVAGDVANEGSFYVDGSSSIEGSVLNSGTMVLNAALELAGPLGNSGTLEIGTAILSLSDAPVHSNSGSITASGMGTGWLELRGDAELTGTGDVANVRGLDGTQSLLGVRLMGDVEAGSGARLSVTVDAIHGSAVANGGELILPALTIERDLVAAGGTVHLTGNVEIGRDLIQTGQSTIYAGSRRIRLHGGFRRDSGAFPDVDAVLEFLGDGTTTFRPGSGLSLDTLQIHSGRIELSGDSLDVRHMLFIHEDAVLVLDGAGLYLSQPEAIVHVEGRIESDAAGVLTFRNATQRVTGNGFVGHLAIELSDENDSVLVTETTGMEAGSLSLIRGALQVAAGSSFTLTDAPETPLIRRNLGDANGDGVSDGKTVIANEVGQGTFHLPPSGFHLEYLGSVDENVETGTEVGSGDIVDFRIAALDPDAGPAVVTLASDLTFSGALAVGPNAVLDLDAFVLEATGAGAVHFVRGTLLADAGSLVLSSSCSIVGNPIEGPSAIHNLTLRSDGLVDIRGLAHVTGSLRLENGETNLALDTGEEAGADSIGSVSVLHLSAPASLALDGHVRVRDAVAIDGGEVRPGNFDIVMDDGSSFSATGASSIRDDGSGRLMFVGGGTLQTGQIRIPRLLIDAGPDGVVRLTEDAGVSRAFVHSSGTLDLQGFTFVNAGRLWSFVDGTYEGPGTMEIQGNVAGAFNRDVHIPSLIMNGSTDQTVFTVRSESDSLHSLTVSSSLTLSRGTIDLGVQDLVLGGVFISEGGRLISSTGNEITDESNGELVLSGADVLLAQNEAFTNVRVRSDSRILPESGHLTITGQIAFEDGSLSGVDTSNVRIAAGARIARAGSGTFADAPSFDSGVDLYYDVESTGTERLVSGSELPPTQLRNLFIAAGGGTVELATTARVRALLELRSGTVVPRAPLEVLSGATIHIRHEDANLPAFEEASYHTTGPVTLLFSGRAGNLHSDDLSFPPDVSVKTLIIRMGDRGAEIDRHFFLHADRSIEHLVLENETPASTLQLSGRTLSVSGNAALNGGIVYSANTSTLDVDGDLTTLPATRIDGAITTIVRGHAYIGGTFEADILRSEGDVTVSGRFGGRDVELDAGTGPLHDRLPNVELVGRDQVLRLTNQDENPATLDDSVNRLTIDLIDSTGSVTYGSDSPTPHTLGVNQLVLERGIIRTGANDLRLPHNGPGFVKTNRAVSHVVGQVSRRIRTGQPNPFTVPFGRFEFPVGAGRDRFEYRPLTLQFTEENPITTASVLTVGHLESRPDGYLGLPVVAGEDVRVDDTADFHWTIASSPPLHAGQQFDLAVAAAGLGAFSSAGRLRIVRRSSGIASKHAWQLLGSADQYDNEVVLMNGQPVPLVRSIRASGGATDGGHIVSIGITTDDVVFSRVQVVNLLEDELDVQIDDSLRASELAYGSATSYLRVGAGRRKVSITSGASEMVGDSLDFEPGRDYLLVATYASGQAGPRLLATNEARATPEVDEKQRTSLSFYNAASVATPLALTLSAPSEILFAEVASGWFSGTYVPVDPVDAEFGVLNASGSVVLASAVADLDATAGMTVAAIAADIPQPSQVGPMQLVFITNHGDRVSTLITVGGEEPVELPQSFSVEGNFPNPFSPSTAILVDLPGSADVTVEVYDLLGRRVMSVGPASFAAGMKRHVEIDGGGLASGVYLYRVTAESAAGTHTGSGKMMLVR